MFLEAAVSSLLAILSYGISTLGKVKDYTKACTKSNKSETQFKLLDSSGTCSSMGNNTVYQLLYFDPMSNPTFDGPQAQAKYMVNNSSALPQDILSTQYQYQPYIPNTSTTSTISPSTVPNTQLLFPARASSPPLNICPQVLQYPNSLYKASCVQLPFKTPTQTIPNFVVNVFPGLPMSGNAINTPAIADSASQGQCNILYISVLQDATLFVELGGAQGGNVLVYTGGVDFTGTASEINPPYVGGLGGIVFGQLVVKQGDCLKVFLGTTGTEVTDPQAITNFQGEGGIATVLGGANGGGPSYLVHYKLSSITKHYAQYKGHETLSAAFDNNASCGTLIAVAGGGGGSGRNASGGSAGFSSADLAYGDAIQGTEAYGSLAGPTFVLGQAPYVVNHNGSSLAGGGGTLSSGGKSLVQNSTQKSQCDGSKLKHLFDDNSRHGGGSVVTEIGSGGGGGGGGYYGGGSGAWNGQSKPGNIHGGGGGGSSMNSMIWCTNGLQNCTLNAYRPWNRTSTDGYLVLGVPIVS